MIPEEYRKRAETIFKKETGYPVGFVGSVENGTKVVPCLTVNGTQDFNLTVTVQDADGDGIIEAQAAGALFTTDNQTLTNLFSEDSNSNGIPDAVEPDFWEGYVDYLPVRDLYFGNDTSPANETFTAGFNCSFSLYTSFYHYHGIGGFLPIRTIDDTDVSISTIPPDSYSMFDDYLYTPDNTQVTDIPIYVYGEVDVISPVYIDNYFSDLDFSGKLTPEELFTLKKHVIRAVKAWNEGIRAGDPNVGMIFMGVAPHIPNKTVHGYNLPAYSTIVVAGHVNAVEDDYEGATSWTKIGEISDNLTVSWNGTTLNYKISDGIYNVSIYIVRCDNYHAIAHELGHTMGFDHPFYFGLQNNPSVMNYYTIGNLTLDVSDWDKEVAKKIYSLERAYAVDFYQVKNWWESKTF